MASSTANQSRVSLPQPASSASSVVAIDAVSLQKNSPMVSQAALEAPVAQPAALEAQPASLTGVSADAKPTTNDSFARHDTYFFNDGNITFLIEGMLYCVHRYFFSRDSVYFSAKFSKLGVRDYESLSNIVSLGDVERKDFEAFLSVIYPENFDEHNLSYEQWRSVLHLSTRWGFSTLRKLALRSVNPPTPCDQLLLARTYGIDHWVIPALSSLCERKVPISLNEARQMSVEDIVLVATVREDIRNDGSQTEVPLRIKATQARIAQNPGVDIGWASSKIRVVAKEPVLAEPVTAGPRAEADSDNSSKTAATLPEEDDKHDGDEHSTASPKAGASVISLGENNKQEVERQIQEAASENGPSDRVEGDPSTQEPTDGSSEKEPKKAKETSEAKVDSEADKVEAEAAPSEEPRIASTLTAEPEEQEQPKRPERVFGATAPPAAISRTTSVASEAQPQAARPTTPLYWRRLTARYMSVGPQPS